MFHLLNVTFIAIALRPTPRRRRQSLAVLGTAAVIISQFTLQGLLGYAVTFLFIGLPLLPALFPSYGFLAALGYTLGPGQAFSIGLSWEEAGIRRGRGARPDLRGDRLSGRLLRRRMADQSWAAARVRRSESRPDPRAPLPQRAAGGAGRAPDGAAADDPQRGDRHPVTDARRGVRRVPGDLSAAARAHRVAAAAGRRRGAGRGKPVGHHLRVRAAGGAGVEGGAARGRARLSAGAARPDPHQRQRGRLHGGRGPGRHPAGPGARQLAADRGVRRAAGRRRGAHHPVARGRGCSRTTTRSNAWCCSGGPSPAP